MKSRSKKYYQKRKEQSGEKKGSVSDAGYNEENEVTAKQSPKSNPAPSKSQDDPSVDTLASQDDTGGGK
ncbi:MAG: hypothetical protein M3Z92_04995 [Bacteroidota bacterium]|nr:hypothetical protein [Bacteroidota bacterium]